MPVPPSPLLDEVIAPPDWDHVDDHRQIADALNNDTASLSSPQTLTGQTDFTKNVGVPGGYARPIGDVVLAGDSAAQIQAKIAACEAADTTLFIPAGTWSGLSATIEFTCAVESDPNAVFISDQSPVASIGDGATIVVDKKIVVPDLRRLTKNWGVAPGPGAGVIGTDVGLRIDNSRSCEIHIPHVLNFSVGIDVSSTGGDGALYNEYYLGHIENCAIEWRIKPGAAGADNESRVYGGRYQQNSGEGVNVAGTCKIKIDGSAGTAVNNWLFLGGSLEGDVAEWLIDCDGPYNTFVQMRFENATSRVRFSGAGAIHNQIDGGYGAETIVVTQTGGATKNKVDAVGNFLKAAMSGGVDGCLVIQPTASNADPVLTGLDTAQDVFGTGASRPSVKYGFILTPQALKGKVPADTEPRVIVDFVNGKIGFGSGAAVAITQFIRQETAALLGFQATGICAVTDATYDVGQAGARRFRDAFLSRDVVAGRVVKTGADITANRPAAATVGVGSMWFDTTLGKPIWSTGAAWVDATGAAV